MKNKIVLYPILFALACILFWTYRVVCSKQLIRALHKNDLAKAELMLTLGADPDYFYNTSTGSPFKLMSKSRKICSSTWNRSISGEKAIEKSKLLLQYGADINKGQCSNTTPLWMIVQNKNTAVTALLLQQKKVDIEKENLLHLALKAKQWKQAKVLVEHGADVNAIDKEGYTPLYEALEDFDTFVYLLGKGANPHYQAKLSDGDSTNILAHIIGGKSLEKEIKNNLFFFLTQKEQLNIFHESKYYSLLDEAILSKSDSIANYLQQKKVAFKVAPACELIIIHKPQNFPLLLASLEKQDLLKDCPELNQKKHD